jgi:hypothetical protein
MVAWVYDDPMYPQDVAKSIDEFRRSGYSVERISGAFPLRKQGVVHRANTDEVRHKLKKCKCAELE